jgi:AAA15 family ATPase/GTPase
LLENLIVKRYRSLREIEIPRLSGLNVITGRNGGGKSSLLEAIFLNLSASNPGGAFTISSVRGDAFYAQNEDSTLRSLFSDMNTEKNIQVIANQKIGVKKVTRDLRISPIFSTAVLPGRSAAEQIVNGLNVKFTGKTGSNEGKFEFNFSQMNFANSLPTSPPLSIHNPGNNSDVIHAQYISPYQPDPQRAIYDQLVNAVKDRAVDEVIATVKMVAPQIKNLSPVSEQGQPRIYVDTGVGRLLPITALGSGFIHILRLALAVTYANDGILLIDELEDGIHFSLFPIIAEFLISVLKKKKMQIFISTHSDELLKAFVSVANKNSFEHICLINMSAASIRNHVRIFEGGNLEYALEQDAELRS